MTSPSGADRRMLSLATAIGLIDGDGNVDQTWFNDPIAKLRGMVSEPVQRRALFDLLDEALPPAPGLGNPQQSWHPLFEDEPFGLYLTVSGDVIGLAARAGTPTTDPGAALVLHLPLIDAAGELTPIAGTAAGPLEVRLDLRAGTLDAGVRAVVDLAGGGSVRIVLRDLDLGEGVPRTVELDPTAIGADAAPVLVALVREVLEQAGVAGNRVVDHLPGVLGLAPGLPPLPIERLTDPAAFRDWIGLLAADPATLRKWAGHLSGLAGGDPELTGAGTEAKPLRAVLLDVTGGPSLALTLARSGTGATGRILIGLEAALSAAGVTLDASATLVAIATGGTAPAILLPDAGISLSAVPPLPSSGAVSIGSVRAGFRWQGTAVQPRLELVDVNLEGHPYAVLDLSSVDAIAATAATAITDALDDLLGPTGPGHALAALIGLVPPTADPTSPHRVVLADLATAPTRAIAAFHRAVLDAGPAHSWSALLAEIVALVGLTEQVTGLGTVDDPWRARLATAGFVTLSVAAWDDPPAAGAHGLRWGLAADAGAPWADVELRAGLLGFDLSPAGTDTKVLPGLALTIRSVPPALITRGGTSIDAQQVALRAGWQPGAAVRVDAHVTGLALRADGERIGPVDFTVPAPGGFDPAAPDLGIGLPPDLLPTVLRLLIAEAALSWGGRRAVITTALLGLHRRLPDLPPDWPMLPLGDLPALLRDPVPALREQLRRLATEVTGDGVPFALLATRWLAAAIDDREPDELALGWGTEDRPWRVPIPADRRVDLLIWADTGVPAPGWAQAYARHLEAAANAADLLDRLRAAAEPVPSAHGALYGRDPDRIADDLESLRGWLAASDGVVPYASQTAVGPDWRVGDLITCAHADLPGHPDAVAQIQAQLDAWAPGDRCVLLLSAPFEDHRVWTPLLAAVDPQHAPDAHFHLRVPGADPLSLDLTEVRAVSPAYTMDLAGGGSAEQLDRVVARARTLTGLTSVHLVAHATAGIVAREYAAAHPDLVAGIITVGTPHAGSPLTGLDLSDALRFVTAVAPAGTAPTVRAAAFLAVGVDRDSYAAPGDHDDAGIPGLAIASLAGPDLIGDLTYEVASAVYDAADGTARPARTLEFGLAVRPDLPAAGDGPQVEARFRVPVGAVVIDPGVPAGPRWRRLEAEVLLSVPDGWLVPEQVRWARAGLTVAGTVVTPIADLHDAADGLLRLPETVDRMGTAQLPLGFAAPAGTAAGLVLDVLRAAGLSPAAAVTLDPAAVRAMVASPAGYLAGPAEAIAGILLPALGMTGSAADGWQTDLPPFGVTLTVSPQPWTAVVRNGSGQEPLSPLELAGTLSMPSAATEVTLAARTGALEASWSDRDGRLTVAVPGWIEPIVLLPPPAQPVVPPGTPAAIAYLAVSAVASMIGDALLPEGQSLAPLGRLLAAPVAALTGNGILAGPGGNVDAGRINELLTAASALLGLGAGPGLALPGGLRVQALADPVRLLLNGTIDLGGGQRLGLGAGVILAGADAGLPTGTLSLRTVLDGTWPALTVTAGVGPHGVTLVVEPEGKATITLLPQVDGVGALADVATRLLPQVLQTLVRGVLADGPPGPVLHAVLRVAAELGVYGDDAEGFLKPERSAELVAMTRPGWLESKLTSASTVVGLLADLLDEIGLPFDQIENLGPAIRATVGLAGGNLAVTAGWAAAGAPIVLVELTGVTLGPVEIEDALLGYDGELHAGLRLGLRPPAPVAFLRPSLAIGVDLGAAAPRFSVQILPFGIEVKDDAAVTLAPVPAFVMTETGALALLQRWGVPLIATVAITAFADDLETVFWDQGPSAYSVLSKAGLIEPGVTPAVVAANPPPAPQMALRGLAALADGLSAPLGDLHIALVTENGRYGVRLTGNQPIDAGDLVVSLRFGETDWLTDRDAGVTVWLLQDPPVGLLPLLRPALDIVGLGVVLSGRDGPLLDSSLLITSAGVFAFATVRFTDQGHPAVTVEGLGAGAQLDEARLVLSADDADSFIAQILPSDMQADLDLAVSWRDGEGLRLYRAAAAGGLELTVPLDVHAAILQLTELWMRLRTDGDTTAVAVAVSGKADLGPLHLVVKRVGIEARYGSGGAGLAFRPPDGAGLSLDTGVVTGGGYLAHDETKYQYAGAVQLQFSAISLKALGIITTRAPDGSPGFSLLVIISAEFTPIQLGFGFTLIGVGGLLGLNRTTDLPVLRAGVREGTLGSILFPSDLVANAPKIISDVDRVFPQAPGRFLIGPMAKLGWGTPPIITVTLGVILDLPAPVRLIILGRVQMVLPSDEDAVVVLNLDVLGVIDFDRGELSFDASLFDSRVAAFDITGDMALRASWGSNPMFALSAGGFHPRFTAPPGFPVLRRLAISLATGDDPRIRLESYLALTANTAQFGARLELYAEAAGFSVEGWLTFDALLQFEPFGFEVDITGGVQLKQGSAVLFAVRVELHLSGPRPWRARGSATFTVLLFEVSVGFDVEFGRADVPALPGPVDVADLLEKALADVRTWSAQLPGPADTLFSLREIVPAVGEFLAHPLGSMTFTQRVTPLATDIERFGSARPKDDTRFDVTVTVGGQAATVQATLTEQFAPGQYHPLSDDQRLTQPSFTPMPAGQRLAAAAAGRDHWQVRAAPLDYEVKLVDEPDDQPALRRRAPAIRRLDTADLARQVPGSPSAASPARRAGRGRFRGPGLGLGVSS